MWNEVHLAISRTPPVRLISVRFETLLVAIPHNHHRPRRRCGFCSETCNFVFELGLAASIAHRFSPLKLFTVRRNVGPSVLRIRSLARARVPTSVSVSRRRRRGRVRRLLFERSVLTRGVLGSQSQRSIIATICECTWIVSVSSTSLSLVLSQSVLFLSGWRSLSRQSLALTYKPLPRTSLPSIFRYCLYSDYALTVFSSFLDFECTI